MTTPIQILIFINQSPIFKGSGLIILGILALLFVRYVKAKGEKWQTGLIIFTLISAFILSYGLFILIFQPQWWLPPR